MDIESARIWVEYFSYYWLIIPHFSNHTSWSKACHISISHTPRPWVGLPVGVKFNALLFSVVSSCVGTLSLSTKGMRGKCVCERDRERERAVHCTYSGTPVCSVVERTCYLPSSFGQQKPCKGQITGTWSRTNCVPARFVNPEKGWSWTDLAHKGHSLNTWVGPGIRMELKMQWVDAYTT
jgi:hypothetical protein